MNSFIRLNRPLAKVCFHHAPCAVLSEAYFSAAQASRKHTAEDGGWSTYARGLIKNPFK